MPLGRVVVTLTPTQLVMKCRNLPNHPTAVFPDRWRALDGNPNFIQEQDFTWHIPLEPRENPTHVAMDATNANRALPGGAIGVAVNGIILHNPFDERVEMDAVWRTDRCCGHLDTKNRTRRGPPPGLFGPRRPPPGP